MRNRRNHIFERFPKPGSGWLTILAVGFPLSAGNAEPVSGPLDHCTTEVVTDTTPQAAESFVLHLEESGTQIHPAILPLYFDRGMPVLVAHTDSGSLELYLDTGAARISIGLPSDAFRTGRLRRSGAPRLLKTNYGSTLQRRVSLSSVRIGDISFRNVACDVYEAGKIYPYGDRGILGLGLLKSWNLLIDYAGEKVVLYDPAVFPEPPDSGMWMSLPFMEHSDGMIITARLEGMKKAVRWMLDTGAVAAREGENEYYNLLKSGPAADLNGLEERDGFRCGRPLPLAADGIVLPSLNFLVFPNRSRITFTKTKPKRPRLFTRNLCPAAITPQQQKGKS